MTRGRARLDGLLAPELKPYLTYSVGLHFALAAAALAVLGAAGRAPKSEVYTIDFVGGPAAVITSAGPAAPAAVVTPPAAAAPPKAGPSADYDEFGRRRGKKQHFVLPRPSLLRGAQTKPPKEEEQAQPPSAAEGRAPASNPSSGGDGGGASAGLSADMPNFPFPWYITRVRQLLWQQWQSRMPRQAGECVIVFSLLPNGAVTDLRAETSSGDSAFDLAAQAAVQDGAPYPPLPPAFKEPFLKVHVTLRSQ